MEVSLYFSSFLRFYPLSLRHTLDCRVVPFSMSLPLVVEWANQEGCSLRGKGKRTLATSIKAASSVLKADLGQAVKS